MANPLNESWYLQTVELDLANGFIPDLIAHESDANGRGIDLYLTQDGEPVSTENMSVSLEWRHSETGHSGYNEFKAIDAASGHWQITYPTAMQEPGLVVARISVYVGEETSITGSKNFKILVQESPIDEGAAEGSNDFTVFQQAVKDMNAGTVAAEKATTAANTAASKADTSASKADTATKNADTATSKANTAANNADKATTAANAAAKSATDAATSATNAASSATSAAGAANKAASDLQAKVDAGDFNGATFTPDVSSGGDLSWDNDKGLPNPKTVNIRGPRGEGLNILDSYTSLEALQAAHPSDNTVGDGYMVADHYYAWDGAEWADCGVLQGPSGKDLFISVEVDSDGNVWATYPDDVNHPDLELADGCLWVVCDGERVNLGTVRGTKIFTGTGAPGTITGQLKDDLYIDTTSKALYKLGTTWAQIATL